jgi:hypothetical protein
MDETMSRQWIMGLFLTTLSCLSSAGTESNQSITIQEADQEQCYEQLMQTCLAKCDKTLDKNCAQLCAENSRNQCRYAGE